MGRKSGRYDTPTTATTRTATSTATASVQPQLNIAIPHYYLADPTNPSPYAGTLDASLEAILDFGRLYPQTMSLMDVLRKDVDPSTNWMELLVGLLEQEKEQESFCRHLLEELLFLVTRTLLPEQIVQNRALMNRMYWAKKNLSLRVTLRYDSLRNWHKKHSNHYVMVESKPQPLRPRPFYPPADYDKMHPGRRPLNPSVWATLIAGPSEGYTHRKMAEAMKHHITDLDALLMYTDEQVAGWSTSVLFQNLVKVVLQWQWLRSNTEKMEDMEVSNWEELDGKPEENEWVRDQPTKISGGITK